MGLTESCRLVIGKLDSEFVFYVKKMTFRLEMVKQRCVGRLWGPRSVGREDSLKLCRGRA